MELKNKKIAIIATDGFEKSELESPKNHLENLGATVEVLSLSKEPIKSWDDGNWSTEFKVDGLISEAKEVYDAVVLPGGVINPDQIRNNSDVLDFLKRHNKAGKPIAAICHGPWSLINAELVKGVKLTSYESLKKDLENAGAHWSDEEVVSDKGIITSRLPKDLPIFNSTLTAALQA
jgi:protease I